MGGGYINLWYARRVSSPRQAEPKMPSELDAAIAQWTPVSAAPSAAVTSARLQLHHAVQVANAPAMSYLPPAPDDSHTTFSWGPDVQAFVSQLVPFPQPRRFGWHPEDLTLLALDSSGKVSATFALRGKTMAMAHDWARAECVRAGGDGKRYTSNKHYEIPAHAVEAGAEFDADPAALRTLTSLWGNAARLLDAIVADAGTAASPVHLWPHHFDVGTLITVDAKRSIGGGFTPGDHYYDEPYWYVSPYPKPTTPVRPPLSGGGVWREGEFFGAVLPWSAYDQSIEQGVAVGAYLRTALNGARTLLG